MPLWFWEGWAQRSQCWLLCRWTLPLWCWPLNLCFSATLLGLEASPRPLTSFPMKRVSAYPHAYASWEMNLALRLKYRQELCVFFWGGEAKLPNFTFCCLQESYLVWAILPQWGSKPARSYMMRLLQHPRSQVKCQVQEISVPHLEIQWLEMSLSSASAVPDVMGSWSGSRLLGRDYTLSTFYNSFHISFPEDETMKSKWFFFHRGSLITPYQLYLCYFSIFKRWEARFCYVTLSYWYYLNRYNIVPAARSLQSGEMKCYQMLQHLGARMNFAVTCAFSEVWTNALIGKFPKGI